MVLTIDECRARLIANLHQQTEELTQLNRVMIALTTEFDLRRLLQLIFLNALTYVQLSAAPAPQ